MLGRHVYRVHSTGMTWEVTKEGEPDLCAVFRQREQAVAEAFRPAGADQPAKVTIDNGDVAIAEEHLFGADARQDIRVSDCHPGGGRDPFLR
jgi:Uncharacterized protein conserved in bacteria (DUF2188)